MKIKLKINKNAIYVLLAVIMFRFTIDFIYNRYISVNYAYYGFLNNPSLSLFLVSFIILIVGSLLFSSIVSNQAKRYSSLFITILFLLSFVPFTSIVFFGVVTSKYIVLNCIYWMLLLGLELVSLNKEIYKRPLLYFGEYRLNEKVVEIVGIVSLLIVVFVSGYYAHFRLNFDLFSVYDYRLEARNYNYPTIVSYLLSWTKSINVVLFAYCLCHKKYVMSLVFFIVQMLSFGIDGLKLTFFMPFVVLLVVLLFEKTSLTGVKRGFCFGLLLFTLLSLVETLIGSTSYLSNLFIRRIMYVPNYLNYCYFDFFQTNTPDYFRSSFLRFFGIGSPYSSEGISYIIGKNYFSSPNMNCNSGLIADALTNLGHLGVVLFPLLIVVLLRLYDACTIDLDDRFVVSASFYYSIIIISSFIMPLLLTHGFIITLLLFVLLQPQKV